MPNVRIEYYYMSDGDYFDEPDTLVNAPKSEYSEWGDITDKELEFLKNNISRLNKGDRKARIVVAAAVDTSQIKESIEQIKEELQKQLEIEKQEAKLRKEREKEIKEKAQEKARLKKLKQLEKLKKELEI